MLQWKKSIFLPIKSINIQISTLETQPLSLILFHGYFWRTGFVIQTYTSDNLFFLRINDGSLLIDRVEEIE